MPTKSTKYKSSDEFDVDRGLDLPEFDFDSYDKALGNKNKKSGPVSEVASGIGAGLKDSFLNTSLIGQTLRKVLPEEYGSAMDIAAQGRDTVRSLYNQAAKEFKPSINSLKQTTRQILPKTDGLLPKKLQARIKDWSKVDDQGQPLSEERMREQALAVELGSMFKDQAEDADRQRDAQDKKDQFRDTVQQLRHRDSMGRLGEVAESSSRIAEFNDKIQTPVLKKQLEISMRQYYAVADLLRETKIGNIQRKNQLEGIVKNTSLPDYDKMSASKLLKQSLQNKFTDVAQNALFGKGTGFISKYIESIKEDLSKKITGGANTAGLLTSGLSMMSSMGDLGGESTSGKGMLGRFLGSIIGDKTVNAAQGKIKDLIDKHPKAVDKIQKGANWLGYGMENADTLIRDRLMDTSKSLGMLEPFRDYLISTLPKIGPETKLDVAGISTATQPAVYSNAAQKSIVEVIPGYLARMQRELTMLRTGKDAPLLSYDFGKNKFTSQGTIAKDIRDSFISKDNRQELNERFNTFFDTTQQGGKNPLSAEAQEYLKKDLLTRSIKGQSTDAKVLANARTWQDSKHKDEITKFFQTYLKTNKVGERENTTEAIANQRHLSSEIGRITRFFNDPRATLQEMARLGQLDEIESSGLYNRGTNELDLDKIVEGLLGTDHKNVKPSGDQEHTPGVTPKQPVRTPVNQTRADQQRKAEQAARELQARREAMAAAPAPGNIAPSEVKLDTAGLDKLFQTQVEAIQKIDPNENLLKIIEEMQKVNKRLEDGVNTYSLSEDYLGPDARRRLRDRLGRLGSRVGDAAATVGNKIKGLKDLTLGDLFGTAGTVAKKGIGLAGKIASSIPSVAKGAWTVASGVGGKALETLNRGAQKFADQFGDLYVGEEKQPRLTRARLKQGIYYFEDQQQKKPLKSFKDISGPVYNERGEEILNAEDLENSYIKGSKITALREIVSTTAGWGVAIGNQAIKSLGVFYGTAVKVGIGAFKMARSLLPPYDVYIKGQDKPVLTAGGFKTGEYFSEKTGKVLKHPRDIDGPVLNKTGDHLITEDDIRTGLVDKNGLTVTNKVARLIGKVTQIAKAGIGIGIKAIRGIAGSAKEFLVGIGQAMKDIFGGVFGLRGEYLKTSQKQLDVQQKILQLLIDRLPEKKKKVLGDTDGDGIRDGSAQEIEKQQAEADKAKKEAAARASGGEDGNVNNPRGGMLGKLAALFGKKKKEEKEDEEGHHGGGILDTAADAADIYDAVRGNRGAKAAEEAGKVAGKAGRFGRLGRIASGVGKAAKWGLKGLGLAGAAYGAYSAYDNLKQGNYGSAALDAGLTGVTAAGSIGGLAGIGSFLGGTASVAGTVAGTIGGGLLTGLGAIISSPILLPALGVAAVGAAGYLAYKYFTQAKLTTLNKVRFYQYGFNEENKDKLKTVFGLESALMDNVKFDGDKAYIEERKLKLEDLMTPFGVRPGSDFSQTWISWFTNRFKPVFLGNLAALRGVNPDVKLSDVDGSKLTADEKLKYLNAAAMPDGPYDRLEAPFPDMKNLSVTSSGVKAAVEIARDELTKAAKDQKTNDAAKAATAATGAAALTATAKGGKDGTGVQAGSAAAAASAAAAGAPSAALKDAAGVGAAGLETKVDSVNISGKSSIPADFIFTGQKGTVDAFTAMRMKTYGLVDMDVAKMRDLGYLESVVGKSITFTKDQAEYDQDLNDLVTVVGPKFGVSSVHTAEGLNWIRWFRSRFLPVFLNYNTLLKKATGKDNYVKAEMSVTPQDQLDIGNAIIATTAVYQGTRVPVWSVSESPWKGYALNPDSKSTDANMESLTEAVKAVKAGEQNKTAKKNEVAKNMAEAQKDGTAAKPTSMLSDPLNVKYNKDRQDKAAATGYIQADKLDSSGKGVRATGDYEGGVAVTHPGKGTGGDINKIPMPTSNDWKGMKEMLSAVAAATGMDVSTLATIVAIESGFNPNARPIYQGRLLSSATGLFQFTDGTWNDMMKEFGAKYGIAPNTPKTDPRANALLGAEFTKKNIGILKNKVKKNITTTDVYMAHFLGAGGATQFLSADPNTIGAQAMPDAARANPMIFSDKTGQPRTLGEIYKIFNVKVQNDLKKYGVDGVAAPTAEMAPGGDKGSATKPTTGTGDTGPTSALPPGQVDAAKKPTAAAAGGGYAGAAAAVVATAPAPTTVAASQTTPPIQTPAATAANSGGGYTSAAKTMQEAPAAPAPVSPVRPVPNFSGWNTNPTPSGRELSAQTDANRKAISDGMVSIGETLNASKDIQQQILVVVTKMATAQAAAAAAKSAAGDTSKPAANTPAAPPIPQRAPAAAVSMKRNM